MKSTLLFLNIFLSVLVYSQCNIITSGGGSIVTSPGATITSSPVTVYSNLNVTYQWYKWVGQLIPISNGTHYSGVTTNQVTIYNVDFSDENYLRCRVTNSTNGCQQDTTFYIDVCQGVIQQPTSITANINSSVTFNVLSSNPNATYQWRTDFGAGFQNISNAGQYSGANTNTLTVYNLSIANNNQYFHCRIGSNCDNLTHSDTVVLLINSSNSLDENYKSKFYISPNPITSSFIINGIESITNVTSIHLKDINGKVVKELEPYNLSYNIQDLKSGVYLIEIITNDFSEIIRIIKQ
jgi:hypothetical protein